MTTRRGDEDEAPAGESDRPPYEPPALVDLGPVAERTLQIGVTL